MQTLDDYIELKECGCSCHNQKGGICCSCDCDIELLDANPPICVTMESLMAISTECAT